MKSFLRQLTFRKARGIFLILLAALFLLIPRQTQAANTWGWSTQDGKYYYTYRSGKKAVGFLKRKGRYYHFDQDGSMSLGWFFHGNDRFFACMKGKMGEKLGSLKTGYRLVGSSYYYFEETGKAGTIGRLKTGWVSVKEGTFYYQENGIKLKSGLAKVGDRLYYFSPEKHAKTAGRLLTGFLTIDGKKYYFRPSGKVGVLGSACQGTSITINSKIYTFNKDGVLIKTEKAPVPTDPNEKFIERIGKMAHKDMKETGILASITVAQAIVESAYGKSELAVKAHNLFGMKAALSGNQWGSKWDGRIYRKRTLEYVGGRYITIYANFRRYRLWKDSIRDHSAYLAGSKISGTKLRYQGITTERNYKKAARIIKKGGYATAPNYVSALCAVIEKYNLTRFDALD